MQIERRVFLVDAELRAASDGRSITGYAARYNTLSVPIPAEKGSGGRFFRERIAPGAFKRAVESGQDVTMLVEHNPHRLLGRTASGTLQLRETPSGLAFKCDMPDTQLGRDTHEMIKRGDLNACSFGFALGDRSDDSWDEEEIEDNEDFEPGEEKKRRSKQVIRTIHNIGRLFDVSVVTRAAYPKGTCVMARAEGIEIVYPEIPAEFRTATECTEERLVRQYGAAAVLDVAFKQGQRPEAARSRRRNLLNQV